MHGAMCARRGVQHLQGGVSHASSACVLLLLLWCFRDVFIFIFIQAAGKFFFIFFFISFIYNVILF